MGKYDSGASDRVAEYSSLGNPVLDLLEWMRECGSEEIAICMSGLALQQVRSGLMDVAKVYWRNQNARQARKEREDETTND